MLDRVQKYLSTAYISLVSTIFGITEEADDFMEEDELKE